MDLDVEAGSADKDSALMKGRLCERGRLGTSRKKRKRAGNLHNGESGGSGELSSRAAQRHGNCDVFLGADSFENSRMVARMNGIPAGYSKVAGIACIDAARNESRSVEARDARGNDSRSKSSSFEPQDAWCKYSHNKSCLIETRGACGNDSRNNSGSIEPRDPRATDSHNKCSSIEATDAHVKDSRNKYSSDEATDVCGNDPSNKSSSIEARDARANDSPNNLISVACSKSLRAEFNRIAKVRVQSAGEIPVFDETSPRSSSDIAKENLLKGDKVWQYVCKRAVLISPLSTSPKHKIGQDSNFWQIPMGNNRRTIRTSVPIYGRNVQATVTCEAAVAQAWLERQTGKLYGLDVEWRPNRGKSSENKVAVVQLSGAKECLVLQMLFIDSIPPALVDFLLDSKKRMAGVGVREDASKLLRDYGLACNGLVELTTLAVSQLGRPECKHMGLKALAKEVIGVTMQKLKRITLSDWAKPVLDRSQVAYACIDAWVSFAVFQKLQVTNS